MKIYGLVDSIFEWKIDPSTKKQKSDSINPQFNFQRKAQLSLTFAPPFHNGKTVFNSLDNDNSMIMLIFNEAKNV